MSKIEQIDKNLSTTCAESHGDTVFYDCTRAPFRIYGLYTPGETGMAFLRMPAQTAACVSGGVAELNSHTTGGRIRFRTDSPFITVRAEMYSVSDMSHMPRSGSAGFDLYSAYNGTERFEGIFIPPQDIANVKKYEYRLNTVSPNGKSYPMRDITVNFPLYSGVRELYIGVSNDAHIAPPTEYKYNVPVVYYGSSITQGACASRPGNSYQAMISRELGCDFINLGFSGNARGEDSMTDYIKELSMSAFVYDYDHNAPTVEHLRNTHERMFLSIRDSKPDIPVIMISRPQNPLSDEGKLRREIIETTYQNALSRGDGKVWFIDGEKFFSEYGGSCETVDGCHPNDIGFRYMADSIGAVLRQALETK